MRSNDIFIDRRGYERNCANNRLVHREVAYNCLYDPNKYPLRFADYVVHHVDRNKLNNHPDNLMILTANKHGAFHGFEPADQFREYKTKVKPNNGCFIATAAYGTPFAEEINVLRFWRDNSLKTNILGISFIKFYYWFSPPIADVIRSSDFLKKVTRMCLNPIVKKLKRKYNVFH